jgi:hypothetical protein
MKKYYWIQDCVRGDLFEERLPEGTTREDAIVTALCEWDRLTANDKKHREYFELVYAPEDDDYGHCDLDKCELIARFC